MAWYSVLPSHLTIYETWIIRTFIILAIANLAPWLCLIFSDFLLYIFRTIYHEVPVYGGRARGERRPRRPSLADRARRMSLTDMFSGTGARRSSSGVEGERERKRLQHLGRGSDSVIEDIEEEEGVGKS